ncbi:hypothetical protein JYP52_21365 [Nitratireductor aquibiodomus]|uniref:hypothetical protein n=1 Tax=Nitratireductor TaxID=245876 RepID=UPI000DE0F6F5|nr:MULTISPECIES: hypothetical protein [Nitratireductor]MBN7763691.1 hypothetical protein [Nitratireductor aquibiodomus]
MKYENLKKVATLVRGSHLNLETLVAIRDNRHLFSQEVRDEFDQFMEEGYEMFAPKNAEGR